ncbi:MAG: hypothetical protein IJW34_02750, partial [Clostridia bacterium]|nr:hypothetical protein [Clostridia bacterium]
MAEILSKIRFSSHKTEKTDRFSQKNGSPEENRCRALERRGRFTNRPPSQKRPGRKIPPDRSAYFLFFATINTAAATAATARITQPHG